MFCLQLRMLFSESLETLRSGSYLEEVSWLGNALAACVVSCPARAPAFAALLPVHHDARISIMASHHDGLKS